MLVDVTVGHLSSLNYILVSLVFFHMFIIFGLCLWIAGIFCIYFLPANLSQDFCLASVHSSSFFVGLYASFLRLQTSYLTCVRHKFDSIFIYIHIILLFCTNY